MATKSQKTYLTEFIVLNLFNLARCEENYVSQFEHISKLLTTYMIYLSKTNTIFLKLWWRPQNCTKSKGVFTNYVYKRRGVGGQKN